MSKTHKYYSCILSIILSISVFIFPDSLYAGGFETAIDKNVLIIVAFILLLGAVLAGASIYSYLTHSHERKEVWHFVRTSSKTDPSWESNTTAIWTKYTFIHIRHFWTSNDPESIKMLVHPDYHRGFFNFLTRNEGSGIFSKDNSTNIDDMEIVTARNYLDESQDIFVARIPGCIDEYWYFQRHEDEWLLIKAGREKSALFDLTGNERLSHSFKDIKTLDRQFAKLVAPPKGPLQRLVFLSTFFGTMVIASVYGLIVLRF